jgi:hypothetical protein
MCHIIHLKIKIKKIILAFYFSYFFFCNNFNDALYLRNINIYHIQI